MNKKFFYELAFLREDLDSVAASIGDIDQSISGNVDADHTASELFVRRCGIVGRRPAVVDLIQRHAVRSPASLEGTRVRIVYDDAPVLITVGDIHFMRCIIHEYLGRRTKDARVLVTRW